MRIAKISITIAISFVFVLYPGPVRANSAKCNSIQPSKLTPEPSKRDITPEDLMQLRDIGPFEPTGPLFSISPDKRFVALQIRQADAASNSYCQAIVIVPLSGKPPKIVDRGGDLMRARIVGVAALTVESGIPEVVTPLWSSDGRWVAFLKRQNGRTQVWKAAVDGSGSEPLTHSDVDIYRFAIVPYTRSLVFATRPDLDRAEEAFEREGLAGFHFDDRFIPSAGSRPQLPAETSLHIETLDLQTHKIRSATPAERDFIDQSSGAMPKPKGFRPTEPGKPAAWIEAVDKTFATPQTTVKYLDLSGSIVSCTHSLCSSTRPTAWLTTDGKRVLYLRREGWADGSTGIYQWDPRRSAPKRILQTDDYIVDCQAIERALLCLKEASTKPRQLVRINLDSGSVSTVFDPNPEWASLRFGRVKRINVQNEFGLKSTADLVYPANYRVRVRYPTIVVQYVSRGLLRGGVGDEYPIFALAANGFAVLSVNRPPHLGLRPGVTSLVEAERINLKSWANRKSILSSIETPLRELISEGIVDEKRIGITGLSDGTTTVQFAALNSSMFSAAAISGCCWERSQGALLGPQIDRIFSEVGYPNLLDAAPEFWRRISLAQNPKLVRFPILIQAADSEYLGALEAYTAMRQAGRPIDMFVFPGEYHNKWQPSHRLSIYKRTIRWFDFWLKDRISSPAITGTEELLWNKMRLEAGRGGN